VARNRYSVPCERVIQWVSSRLYPSRVVVVADETTIASHERLFDRDQVSYDWQHYIPLIARKPGALRNGAPFADLPKPLRLLRRGLRRHVNGDRFMTQVLAAVPITGLDSVRLQHSTLADQTKIKTRERKRKEDDVAEDDEPF
jgi:hypothetical protein